MSVAGASLLALAFAFHLLALFALFAGARWLGQQRRLGYPDPRAQAINRRGILVAIAAAWIWANVFVLSIVAAVSARI